MRTNDELVVFALHWACVLCAVIHELGAVTQGFGRFADKFMLGVLLSYTSQPNTRKQAGKRAEAVTKSTQHTADPSPMGAPTPTGTKPLKAYKDPSTTQITPRPLCSPVQPSQGLHGPEGYPSMHPPPTPQPPPQAGAARVGVCGHDTRFHGLHGPHRQCCRARPWAGQLHEPPSPCRRHHQCSRRGHQSEREGIKSPRPTPKDLGFNPSKEAPQPQAWDGPRRLGG